MRQIAFIGILCFLVMSIGCGRNPEITQLSESSVVVAFGNSLTFGTGTENDQSYPAVLSDMLQCRVVNAGVPGEDTSSALDRLPTILRKEKADLVIICHGGNDMLRNQNRNTTKQNIDAMISIARNAGADVILIGVPSPGLFLNVPSFYKKLAKQHDIPYDSDIIADILSNPSLKSDYVHPNAEGYYEIAQAIADLINKSQKTQ